MNDRMKHLLSRAMAVITLFSMLAVSCAQPSVTSPPASRVTIDVSFPSGAPALNEEAELRAIVTTLLNLTDMRVEIKLPKGLELVSGELSWMGDISTGELTVVDATVRAIETGNWTIEVHSVLDPTKNSGVGMGGATFVYVSISEDSAQWGIYPPWLKGGNVVPIEPVKDSSSPLKVHLSISQAPVTNATASSARVG